MPIQFVSLNEEFITKIKSYEFEAYLCKIEDYVPNKNKRTYYVSPANSLCFMDGGIDLSLSRIVFSGIEKNVRSMVQKMNITTKLGRPYLPIGSSLIIDYDNQRSLIVSPTMLLPQDVSKTQNAYYTTIAILYNILVNRKEDLHNINIVFTSLCCGYGKMSIDESISQILDGIRDYQKYNPVIINNNIILCEPNLKEQPKYYQNSEWFDIDVKDIVKI